MELMTTICNNCTNAFKSDMEKDYNGWGWPNIRKFQITMCPRCDSLLYWRRGFDSSLAKCFDNLSETDQHFAIKQVWENKRV